MLGILFIGISLILGISVRLASSIGAFMLVLMYTAGFMPPEHNPFLDEHVINFILMFGFIYSQAGNYLGLGKWWENTSLVRKLPILK